MSTSLNDLGLAPAAEPAKGSDRTSLADLGLGDSRAATSAARRFGLGAQGPKRRSLLETHGSPNLQAAIRVGAQLPGTMEMSAPDGQVTVGQPTIAPPEPAGSRTYYGFNGPPEPAEAAVNDAIAASSDALNNESTWGETLQKPLENATATFNEAIGGGIQELGELAPRAAIALGFPAAFHEGDPLENAPEVTQNKVSRYGAQLHQSALAAKRANQPDLGDNTAKQFAYDTESAIVNMVPSIAAGMLNPAAGMATLFAQVSGQKYGQSRAEGKSAQQAFIDSGVYGAAETLTETPIFRLIGKPGQTAIGKIVKGTALEGTGESINNLVESVYDAGVDKNKTIGEVLQNPQTWRDTAWNGAIGAAMGGAIVTPSALIDATQQSGTTSEQPAQTGQSTKETSDGTANQGLELPQQQRGRQQRDAAQGGQSRAADHGQPGRRSRQRTRDQEQPQSAQQSELGPTGSEAPTPGAFDPAAEVTKSFQNDDAKRSSARTTPPDYEQTRPTFYQNPDNAGVDHKKVVADALKQKKPVPADVLLDYPDLIESSADTPPQTQTPKSKNAQPHPKPPKTKQVSTGQSKLDVAGEFIDAGDLNASHTAQGNVNPNYPASLQPRDRTRLSNGAQVDSMSRQLDPELLDDTAKASDGAPIIGADNVVESGNGRVAAIKHAYDTNRAQGYQQFVQRKAQQAGVDVSGMDRPVYVRRRTTPMTESQRAEFARQANQSNVAPMSPAEQARSDAARLTDDDMAHFDPGESGNVLAASNDAFLRRFADKTGDVDNLRTANGRWNKRMADRAQAAVFQKAYHDPRLLEAATEEADPEMRNVLSGLQRAAPAFARAGDPYDTAQKLTDAVDLVRDARAEGQDVSERINQTDAFNADDPDVAQIARVIDANKRSGKRLGAYFSELGNLTAQYANEGADRLFGDTVTTSDIIDKAGQSDGEPTNQPTAPETPTDTVGRVQSDTRPSTQVGEPTGRGRAETGEPESTAAARAEVDTPTPPDDGATGGVGEHLETNGYTPNTSPHMAAYRQLGSGRATLEQTVGDAETIVGVPAIDPIRRAADELGANVPMAFDPNQREIRVNPDWPLSRADAAISLVEERYHALDVEQGQSIAATSPRFDPQGGDLWDEANKAINRNVFVETYLFYPVREYGLPVSRRKAELFARLGVLYSGNREAFRRAFPKAHEVFYATDAHRPDSAISSTLRPDARRRFENGGDRGHDAGVGGRRPKSHGDRPADPELDSVYASLRSILSRRLSSTGVNEPQRGLDLTGDDPYATFNGQDGPRQGDLFATRPGTTQAQRDVGRSAIRGLERRVLGRGRGQANVLGLRLLGDYRAKGANALTGQRVESPADLATLAQVYRDPRFETFRALFVKDGRIVGENAYTSRLPSAVSFDDSVIPRIDTDKNRFGADGYYLLHNHPSGNPQPSRTDRHATEVIAGQTPGFRGHVIIDHNQYSVLDSNSRSRIVDLDRPNESPTAGAAGPKQALIGQKVTDPGQLATLAKQTQDVDTPVVVTTGRDLNVQAVFSVPTEWMMHPKSQKRFMAFAARAVRETGSGGHTFAIVPGGLSSATQNAIKNNARRGQYGNTFMDIVLPDGSLAARDGMGPRAPSRVRTYHVAEQQGDLFGDGFQPPSSYRQPTQGQSQTGDLFGDDTRDAQALADETRRRDAIRSPGTDVPADRDGGLFANQTADIENAPALDPGRLQTMADSANTQQARDSNQGVNENTDVNYRGEHQTALRPLPGQTVFKRYADLGRAPVAMRDAVASLPQIMGFESPFPVVDNPELAEYVPAQFNLTNGRIEVNTQRYPHDEAVQYLAEEVLHGIDSVSNDRTLSAASPLFDGQLGAVGPQAQRLYAEGGPLSDFLYYPIDPEHGLTRSQIKAELFARLGMLYFGEPDTLATHFPQAHAAFHDIYKLDVRGTPDSGRAVFGRVWAGAQEFGSRGGQSGPGGQRDARHAGFTRAGRESAGGRRLEELRDTTARALHVDRRGARVQFSRGQSLETRGQTGRLVGRDDDGEVRGAAGVDGEHWRVVEPTPDGLGYDTTTVRDRAAAEQRLKAAGLNVGAESPRMSQTDLDFDTLELPSGYLGNVAHGFQYKVQDKFNTVKQLQNQAELATGNELADADNTYQSETLYHGAARDAADKFDEQEIQPMLDDLLTTRLGLDGLTDYVPDLPAALSERFGHLTAVDAYLYARHAPESNARLAEMNPGEDALSGMSDAEALQIHSALVDQGEQAALDRMAARVDRINQKTRDWLVESGLESRDTIDAWEGAYDYYVPLKGTPGGPDANVVQRLTNNRGRGFDTRAPASKQRLGRRSPAQNILSNVIGGHYQALVKGYKNGVGQSMLRFAQQYPSSLYEVDQPQTKRVIDPDTGLVKNQADPSALAKDNVFIVRVGGVRHHIVFNENDPNAMRMAQSLKNMNEAQLGPFLRLMHGTTRYLSRMSTGWNPEFFIPNFFRDLQEAAVNLNNTQAHDLKGRITGDTMKGTPYRAIRRYQKGRRDGEWAGYYGDFLADGASTGWQEGYDSINAFNAQMTKRLNRHKPGTWAFTKRSLRNTVEFIDHLNDAVENGVRLAAYVHLRKAGVGRKKAAATAKDLTINFNRKGEYGDTLNALYMFANASIQGNATIFRTAMQSKKARRWMAAAVGTGIVGFLGNYLLADDNEDAENEYTAIPAYIKRRNWIVMLSAPDWMPSYFAGPKGDYIKFPMPYGYNVLNLIGQKIGRAGMAATVGLPGYNPADDAIDLGIGTLDSFNPIGGATNLLQMVSPTVTDPFVEWAQNENFAGLPIHPTPNPYAVSPGPAYKNTFSGVRGWSKWVTKELNMASGGSQVKPGHMNINPELVDHLTDFMFGGAGRTAMETLDLPFKGYDFVAHGTPINAYQIPFVGKVYGTPRSGHSRELFYNRREKLHYLLKADKLARKNHNGARRRALHKHNPQGFAMAHRAHAFSNQLTRLNQRKHKIEASKTLSDARKSKLVDEIKDREQTLYHHFNQRYKALMLTQQRPPNKADQQRHPANQDEPVTETEH